MSQNNEYVLVTGGAGFIGSHLCEKLLKAGKNVVCFDNFDGFYSKKIKQDNIQICLHSNNFFFVEGDIRDKRSLLDLFSAKKISLVVHLAAKAGVRPSVINPEEFYDVNVKGTLNLLEVMKTNEVKNLIFSSSSSVYGNQIKQPYTETDNVDHPISPYAATKKAGELLTYTFHHLYGFNVANLRFFTVYGPRQRPDLAIHKFFKNIYNQQSIDIYGDGNTSRDYTFIDDIISGIIAAMHYIEKNKAVYETVNLGNSNPVKLNGLIELIEKTTQQKFIKKYLPMQEGDVNHTYADTSKAHKLFNYSPSTALETGLVKFKEWYEKFYTEAL